VIQLLIVNSGEIVFQVDTSANIITYLMKIPMWAVPEKPTFTCMLSSRYYQAVNDWLKEKKIPVFSSLRNPGFGGTNMDSREAKT
jgi:hypothetical protein